MEVKEKKYMKRRDPVDIESEFIGKPVGPRQKKEKKEDLTDEINKFLESPSLEGIIIVLLRPESVPLISRKNARLKAYKTEDGEYIIKIIGIKDRRCLTWYMAPFHFCKLCYFKAEKWDSRLKQEFCHELRRWLLKNPSYVQMLSES